MNRTLKRSIYRTSVLAAATLLALSGTGRAASGYYSEFVGDYCTPEQETAAMEASRQAQAREVHTRSTGAGGGKYYSEFMGRDCTEEEETAAMEASRQNQKRPVVITAAAGPKGGAYYSELAGRYIVD